MPAPSSSTGDADADAVIASQSAQSGTGDADADAVLAQKSATPSAMETYVTRPLGITGRAIMTGVSALPLMVMDAGVEARNVIGDETDKLLGHPQSPDYELPSQEFQESMTAAGLPVPRTTTEKGASFVESTLAGGEMSPEEAAANGAAEVAPGVRNGIAAGYKVPPATTNPTLANKALETTAGKIATQQAASAANQKITNRLASQALGLNPAAPLTKGAIQAVRAEAAQDYAAIANVPKIPLDDDFTTQIQGIVSQFNKTAEELPSLASKDLDPVSSELSTTPQLSGQAALGAIRGLRDKADVAFRAGDGGTGTAYRQMAGALEDAVDRGISRQGPQYQGVVDAFRTARQRIAISHSVENAFNESTGNVVAPKLGTALKNGAPLSGPLRTIAEFSNSFKPAVTAEPNSSAVSHLDVMGSLVPAAIEAGVHGTGWGTAAAAAAYPAARSTAKWWLMGLGQRFALPSEESAAGTTISSQVAKRVKSPKWWLSGPLPNLQMQTQE